MQDMSKTTTEQETSIAQKLRIADGEPKHNEVYKRLLSEKPILARIMQAVIPEYQDCDVNDIAEKYIKEDPKIFSVPNEKMPIYYDIHFRSVVPKTGEDEQEYYIGICLGPPKGRENTVSQCCLDKDIKHRNSDVIPGFTIFLGDPNEARCANGLRMLDVLLSRELKLEDGKQILINLEEKKRILETEFGIAMTETIERRMSDMCNLS